MPVSAALFTTISAGALLKKEYEGLLDEDGVNDRAFRIAHNAGQVKVDKYAAIGAGVGASVGAILGRAAVRSVLSSSLTGVAAGVVAYASETFALPELRKMGAL